ncbi:hypothetical protein PAXRUDRAFT_22736, partial [Paxillus rubicundulus Ve08.2h10]
MDNAMHAARAVMQHADVIPGIVIAVEQLIHPEAAVWPNWMGMIQWTHKSVVSHPWARQGTIVCTEYEFGDSSTNANEAEPMGAEEEEARGAQILQMKMEEEDEEDVAYRRRRKEHAKGKKRADATEAESLLGKRKVDEALEDERERGRPRMCGSSSTAPPMLIPRPGGRMTAAKRPNQMMKAEQAAERRDDIESEDEDPIGDATPAPPSPPPRTPIPVPNPAQQRQGCRRGAQKPLAAPQPANACLTCVDFGILCEPNPGYSCFTCRSRKKKCEQSGTTRGRSALRARQPTRSQAPSEAPALRSRCPSRAASSKWAISISAQPSANPQDRPNVASTSTGIKLRIPPPRT